MDTNEIIRVDDWVPSEEDRLITHDGKLLIIPFDKIFNRDVSAVNNFVIMRLMYSDSLGDEEAKEVKGVMKEGTRGVCHYLNYFIKFYDPEKELILAYLKIKHLIDDKNRNIELDAFIQMVYYIILTDGIQEKIIQMVEDNYYVDIEENKGKYPEAMEFNNEHAKIMMCISMAMKIMIPVIFHYISSVADRKKTIPLYSFYSGLFDMFGDDVDIYRKLWITIRSKIVGDYNSNKGMWDQREILGIDLTTEINNMLKVKIISETMFKYTFNKNIIGLNVVVMRNQLGYSAKIQYDHTLIELTNEKNTDGLSSLDKLEITSSKVDESIIILSDTNIKKMINKLTKELNIEITDAEVSFYRNNHKMHRFQVQLVNYYYARYFGGYRDLNMLTRDQYLRLLIILKHKLTFQGNIYLPQIISGNVEKLNKRVIQNKKFLDKVEKSAVYISLIEGKFSSLPVLDKSNLIISHLSTLLNTPFTVVDYSNPGKLGDLIELGNPDILSNEFLNYLSQI